MSIHQHDGIDLLKSLQNHKYIVHSHPTPTGYILVIANSFMSAECVKIGKASYAEIRG